MPNAINKKSWVPKVVLKKDFKFGSNYSNNFFILLLILSLSKTDILIEKRSGKNDFIKVNNLGNIEIVYILLAKIIVIYIKFFKIEFYK